MLTRVGGVLAAKERVLPRVMSSKKAKASTKDNWYQRALRDDPEGAAKMREERALAAKQNRVLSRRRRERQSTREGRLRIEFCMLYSQAMALALTRTTPQTTTDDYLELVFAIMHRYMRQF